MLALLSKTLPRELPDGVTPSDDNLNLHYWCLSYLACLEIMIGMACTRRAGKRKSKRGSFIKEKPFFSFCNCHSFRLLFTKAVNTQEPAFPRMSDSEFLSKGLIIFFGFVSVLLSLLCFSPPNSQKAVKRRR